MSIQSLGYYAYSQKQASSYEALSDHSIARVLAAHKERYTVQSDEGSFEAEVIGKIRFTAQSRADYPAVGDWVEISPYGPNEAIIYNVLPRTSVLSRKAAGSEEGQLIATNVDTALIVQAMDRDFNLNRIDRFIALAQASHITPWVVLSKVDLLDEASLQERRQAIQKSHPGIAVLSISNQLPEGITHLQQRMQGGATYCLIGSSGVGKSTLINQLRASEDLATGALSQSTGKGRHTTTHRELFVPANGAIVIDNPGVREVGLVSSEGGTTTSFEGIEAYAAKCRFKDCTHTNEPGCAVIEAMVENEIPRLFYENYLKLRRESEFFESSALERKRKGKELSKLVKRSTRKK